MTMDLLIDIGNTRLKWAMCDAGRLHDAARAAHRADPAGAVDSLFDGIGAPPARVCAANVAGERLGALVTQAARDRWGLTVQFAATRAQGDGVCNGYTDYRQLGVDRWLAIVAAVDGRDDPVCVVDAGTAVTIDMVAANGEHRGGFIVPGLELMRRALGAETGDLRRLAGETPLPADDRAPDCLLPGQPAPGNPAPGKNTAAAMAAGSVTALCALIDRCVESLHEGDAEPLLIMTGGDAGRLAGHVGQAAHLRPQLVLEGLARYDFSEPAE